MRYTRNKQVSPLESLSLASVCATAFLCGVVEATDEAGGWARPQRFGAQQRRALSSCLAWHPGQYRQMATTTAGVCLRFATDATNVAVAVKLDREPQATAATLKGWNSEPHDGFSLVVDGRSAGMLLPEDDLLVFSLADASKGLDMGMAALPGLGERHEVCLWFPCLRGCVIRELWIDGSFVEPLPARPRLLVLGDEIGQGYCCTNPALAWPVLLAQHWGLELINQSVAGQVFQPSSILDARVNNVGRVVVELGSNYLQERCDTTSVAADVRGFLIGVSRHWPDASGCALVPTWHDARTSARNGSCFASVPQLVSRTAKARSIEPVDGKFLVSEGLCVLPSGAEVLDQRGNERLATRLLIALDQADLSSEDLRKRALAYLARAPLCAFPAFEAIRRGGGEVLIAQEGCVVLRVRNDSCMIWARDASMARDVCGIVQEPRFFNVLGENLVATLGPELGLSHCDSYCVCVYKGSESAKVDSKLASCIRPLDNTYEGEICTHYRYSGWVDRGFLVEALRQGRFFGAFVNDELVGFVGEHPEGSIGMLEVFEGHQRAGWGRALLAAKIRDHLARGETPWTEVYPHNAASLRLHKKLGFECAPATCAHVLSEESQDTTQNEVRHHERD